MSTESRTLPHPIVNEIQLINEYVSNLRDGHAAVTMAEVSAHLDETYFAWVGATGTDAVFYYRIHSPVILIEFDHQGPGPLGNYLGKERAPSRDHIHTTLRTPNGNDYGRDLLRQRHLAYEHKITPAGVVHVPRFATLA